MKQIDLEKLIDWLGPEGAIAGLEASNMTVTELFELANSRGLVLDRKARRKLIAIELVNSRIQRIDKSIDELLKLSKAELKSYFESRLVSGTELTKLLADIGIQAGSEDRKNLWEFAAREISDMGMYQRVARGLQRGRSE